MVIGTSDEQGMAAQPDAYSRLRLLMLDSERRAVMEARREGRYEETVIDAVLGDFDSIETALKRSYRRDLRAARRRTFCCAAARAPRASSLRVEVDAVGRELASGRLGSDLGRAPPVGPSLPSPGPGRTVSPATASFVTMSVDVCARASGSAAGQVVVRVVGQPRPRRRGPVAARRRP